MKTQTIRADEVRVGDFAEVDSNQWRSVTGVGRAGNCGVALDYTPMTIDAHGEFKTVCLPEHELITIKAREE